MKKILLLPAVLLITAMALFAREGMWIPALMKKYNIEEMQRMGFRLGADEVYSTTQPSMKDAVVIFGGGCTGELISPEGLLITNHHCGYSQIQQHSTLENDYLTHGFWAKERSGELPCQGLSVSFLEYMEDVTPGVVAGVDTITKEEAQAERIRLNINAIEREASQNGKLRAQVRPLFYGNQYYLHVYKIYTDVRLVGAPPSSIGKFGGDTDNWVWPRHTGDFSLFRIYAGKDNEPAAYSPANVPFRPKRFFPISLKGVQPGDFTMVFGYPGRTTRFLTTEDVELITNQRDPDRIAIRDKKLEILNRFMAADQGVRIQYAAKHAGVSNSWKKWQGEVMGLEQFRAVEKKREAEKEFESWARNNNLWEGNFDQFFRQSRALNAQYAPVAKAADYYSEVLLNGVETFTLAGYIRLFLAQVEREGAVTDNALTTLHRLMSGFYRNFHQPVDEALFTTLIPMVVNDLGSEWLPAGFKKAVEKYAGTKLLTKVYRKSMLTDSVRLKQFLSQKDLSALQKIRRDPLMSLFLSLRDHYDTNIRPLQGELESRMEAGMKHYVAGIMQMNEGTPLPPDANSTLRVSYGRVEGYQPRDGVVYNHITTARGILEKDNPDIYDYDVPQYLKELVSGGEFGRYGEKGKLPVCVVASNHTSGGNSGSPLINGDGHLIGINFDRCWEGTMSDVMYDPSVCRNISLDIRYALFLIDKFAGAGYLLDEMSIVE